MTHAHIHSAWELWGLFYLGSIVHVLKGAGTAVRHKAFKTRLEFLRFWSDIIAARVLLASGLFWLCLNPGAFSGILPDIGLSKELVVSGAFAAMFGFFSDSLLDYVAEKFPRLKRDIPIITEESSVLVTKTSTPLADVVVTEKVTKTTETTVPPKVEKEIVP